MREIIGIVCILYWFITMQPGDKGGVELLLVAIAMFLWKIVDKK